MRCWGEENNKRICQHRSLNSKKVKKRVGVHLETRQGLLVGCAIIKERRDEIAAQMNARGLNKDFERYISLRGSEGAVSTQYPHNVLRF